MLVSISHLFLQHYWWGIISLLASLLVFLLFVQGGQTLIYTLGKSDTERTMIVNSLGRKWEFTFTTLVTFGGALFASFPLFYATSFGGAYWVWMAILFCFIIQAVAYEFRSKPNNFLGKRTYEIFLFINGAFGTFLLGTVVATFFTGSQFSVNEMNLSRWETPYRGLEIFLNMQNLALGFSVFFLARVLGLLYIINSIEDTNIHERSKKHLLYNAIPFLVFFLGFVIRLLFIDGFAIDPETKEVFMESNKYLHNFLQMPLNTIIFLVGVILVLWGIGSTILNGTTKGIWYSGSGTILTIFSMFILVGFNNTSFYPSTFDLQSSLTIENASSSFYTLKALLIVSFLVPFVVVYIWYAWKSISKIKITEAEMEKEIHSY